MTVPKIISDTLATIRPIKMHIEVANITLDVMEFRKPDQTVDYIEITLIDTHTERTETKQFSEREAFAIICGFLNFDEPGEAFVQNFPFWV